MSKWSTKRKGRYLTVIALVVLLIIILLVAQFYSKEPSCFDGIQNGQENGVDCGGTCQIVCREDIRNIVVWWERPFQVAPGVYNAVAYFENQNLESGIREVVYEFRLYDRNNVIVSQPIVGKTFIEPNKRSAVFVSGITTGDKEAYTAFFKIISEQEWEKTDQAFAYTLFQVGEPVLTEQQVSPKLSVSIENLSLFEFNQLPVIAILYNQQDNAIGTSRTYVDRIVSGEKQTAYFSWPEPFGDDVSRIEIIPRVDPFASY